MTVQTDYFDCCPYIFQYIAIYSTPTLADSRLTLCFIIASPELRAGRVRPPRRVARQGIAPSRRGGQGASRRGRCPRGQREKKNKGREEVRVGCLGDRRDVLHILRIFGSVSHCSLFYFQSLFRFSRRNAAAAAVPVPSPLCLASLRPSLVFLTTCAWGQSRCPAGSPR